MLVGGNKANGRITSMDFRREDFVQGPAWKHPMGTVPERRGAGELTDFQGSPPPRSRMVHPALCSKGGRRPAWINKMLLTKLQHKKEEYKRWKTGVKQSRRNKDTVQVCSNEVRKAKAH